MCVCVRVHQYRQWETKICLQDVGSLLSNFFSSLAPLFSLVTSLIFSLLFSFLSSLVSVVSLSHLYLLLCCFYIANKFAYNGRIRRTNPSFHLPFFYPFIIWHFCCQSSVIDTCTVPVDMQGPFTFSVSCCGTLHSLGFLLNCSSLKTLGIQGRIGI